MRVVLNLNIKIKTGQKFSTPRIAPGKAGTKQGHKSNTKLYSVIFRHRGLRPLSMTIREQVFYQ